jgi:hypothetical protein
MESTRDVRKRSIKVNLSGRIWRRVDGTRGKRLIKVSSFPGWRRESAKQREEVNKSSSFPGWRRELTERGGKRLIKVHLSWLPGYES